jgi:uridine phosphorylase
MNEQLSLFRHHVSSPSAFTPEALVTAVRNGRTMDAISVPPICVLDFDGDLTDWLLESRLTQLHPGWACFHTTMHAFQVDGMECGLIARTIGGPYAVLVAEQLHVSGAQIILGLTSAGRVAPSLPLPSLVIATSAIRDEGTSYHYLPAADIVAAPSDLANAMYRGLHGLSLPVSQGLVWTTDAPYRETVEELEENFTKGALAVEMQAASLFAFASARHANVAVVAHVTNAIDQTRAPFDKGSDEHGWETVQAMCRASGAFLDKFPG